MNTITWKADDAWGIEGHIPQEDSNIYTFKIYLPGDPCNADKHSYLLRNYLGGGFVKTRHPTLKAAKDAARRAYYRAYGLAPKRKVVVGTWKPSWYSDDEFLHDGHGTARYFVGVDFSGKKGHVVTANAGREVLGVFPTRDEAKRFAEKLLREAGND